jgi:hypothetical protein
VAFDRPTHYDPAADPIVRVEARRLRKKLDESYLTHGANDPVVIQLPKGGYLAAFQFRRGCFLPFGNYLQTRAVAREPRP